MAKPFQIAIDGPVAAGKGTVSQYIAKKLNILYVDTGAMYRVAALLALRQGIELTDEKMVVQEVTHHVISMQRSEQGETHHTRVLIEGEDVSGKIRTEEVSLAASKVAVLKSLRAELVRQQQEIAKSQDVVMEGRDIGTKVLPGADLKIYMDAQLNTRVLRRQKQLEELGEKWSFEEVKAHIIDRDTREMTRDIDPLRPAENAWILDTTHLTIEEVVARILKRVESLRKNE